MLDTESCFAQRRPVLLEDISLHDLLLIPGVPEALLHEVGERREELVALAHLLPYEETMQVFKELSGVGPARATVLAQYLTFKRSTLQDSEEPSPCSLKKTPWSSLEKPP